MLLRLSVTKIRQNDAKNVMVEYELSLSLSTIQYSLASKCVCVCEREREREVKEQRWRENLPNYFALEIKRKLFVLVLNYSST